MVGQKEELNGSKPGSEMEQRMKVELISNSDHSHSDDSSNSDDGEETGATTPSEPVTEGKKSGKSGTESATSSTTKTEEKVKPKKSVEEEGKSKGEDKGEKPKEAPPSKETPESDDDKSEDEDESKTDDENDKKEKPKKDKAKKDKSKKDKSKKDKSKKDKKDKSKEDKDVEKEKEKEKKMVPKGMKPAVKTLFGKKADCKCCTTWVEENPDEANKSVEESDECQQHAIVVRKKKEHQGTRKPLKVDSIVVHSPLLKKVLEKVFDGYPDLVIDLDELVFSSPFSPFFHRWETFVKAKDEETDEPTKSHLDLLHSVLAAELKTVIQRHKDLVRHKVIDYEILWTLYPAGELIYSHDDGHDRLYRITDCEYGNDYNGPKFTVRCQSVDWDGEKFGTVSLNDTIRSFRGTKAITTVSSYPIRFHATPEELKKKCVERGRKFKSLAGVHCKDYKGTAIEYIKFANLQTMPNKRHVEGRVMLDEEMFVKFNPDEAQDVKDFPEDTKDKELTLEKLIQKENGSAADRSEDAATKADEAKVTEQPDGSERPTEGDSEEKKSDDETGTPDATGDEKDEKDEKKERQDKTEPGTAADDSKTNKQELTEDQLAICCSWLRGYSLSNQKWAAFSVDDIKDVEWNDDAFTDLTLPEDYRELILATIQTQIKHSQGVHFDDFIRGKGRGYIMLFSGNPGVGKTATAESIAELLHVPLCIISVGNLGTNAESVETALQDILEIAAKWNAVLLLDEADIFLEQRTKHDLHRNAVVSVFLRLLEYYQGVLCLTTNRSEEIDVAFHSRIHISLPFPDLTENSREQIWRQFAKVTNRRAEAGSVKDPSAGVNGTKTRASDDEDDIDLVKVEQESDTGSETKGKVHESKKGSRKEKDEGSTGVTTDDGSTMTGCTISASDFRKLSQYPLNGRQIKNAFKTAVLLASYKNEKVGLKHIKTALKTIDGLKRDAMGMYT